MRPDDQNTPTHQSDHTNDDPQGLPLHGPITWNPDRLKSTSTSTSISTSKSTSTSLSTYMSTSTALCVSAVITITVSTTPPHQ